MAAIFSWNDSFLTHIDSIDSQHRRLVMLINELGEMLMSADDLDPERFIDVRDQLFDYIHIHFADEEQIMSSACVDPRHAERHLAAHRSFIADALKVDNFSDNLTSEEARELVDYLINWLAYHILDMDQEMTRQVHAIQGGFTPNEAYQQEVTSKHDQAGPLLAAMKGLFYTVSERNRELRVLNQELELRIEQRTRELEQANRQLQLIATQDDLTRLPNRRYAMLSLNQLWQEKIRYHEPLAILLVDADRFKEVNDQFGHAQGDALLKELGTRLHHTIRASDIVCRLGGDEFLVICPRTGAAGARTLAGKLLASSTPFCMADGTPCWSGSISIGIAEASSAINSPEELLQAADQAMYQAKRQGGSQTA